MICNRRDLKEYLYEDRLVNGLYDESIITRFIKLHFDKRIKFHTLLRYYEYHSNLRCQSGYKKIIHLFPLLFYYYRFKTLSYRLGFTIHKNCFGPGLCIKHYGSIVVSPHSRIGRNCIIHSCVNIGETNGKAPIIGDNAYIGPGAKIWGDIIIGNNVRIGANAVVKENFPEDNLTLVGVPAKKIQR